jgi:hypothetical protein
MILPGIGSVETLSLFLGNSYFFSGVFRVFFLNGNRNNALIFFMSIPTPSGVARAPRRALAGQIGDWEHERIPLIMISKEKQKKT